MMSDACTDIVSGHPGPTGSDIGQLGVLHGLGHGLQLLHQCGDGLLDTASDLSGVGAGSYDLMDNNI
jgi:hypothetical protein